MSDSLRDQLLQAGFSETRKKKTAKKKPGSHATKQRDDQAKRQADKRAEQANKEAAEVAQRKATKAKIKSLIEGSRIEEFKGESVYRFILGKRIRELHVSEAIREKLNEGSFVITRLNGKTEIVPADTAKAIEAINPDWAIVRPGSDTDESEDDEYSDYKVPDDLQW